MPGPLPLAGRATYASNPGWIVSVRVVMARDRTAVCRGTRARGPRVASDDRELLRDDLLAPVRRRRGDAQRERLAPERPQLRAAEPDLELGPAVRVRGGPDDLDRPQPPADLHHDARAGLEA